MRPAILKSMIILTGILYAFFHFAAVAESSIGAPGHTAAFPVFDCIQPNVQFWKDVYAKYSTTQGVIHDSEDLAIIYEVIELQDRDRPGARKKNKRRVKKVKKKYADILHRLAAGKKAGTAEEKRVLDLFGPGVKAATLRKAARNIRFQLGQKDVFRQGLIRSGAYLEEIKEILASYGLPEELAYLPHVESSFNYKAYSKFGAAGIWQFTRSTGKRFMTVDYTLDERRDPIRATHAAARFLKENHEKLASWPLAVTAYNHGANGMLRAQQAKGGYERIFTEYKSRLFKFASRNFYSEFLAATEVAKNYRKYFGPLTLAKPVHSHEVTLAGYVPVEKLTEYFKLDMDTFRRLNPSLRDPVYTGQKHVPKGYRLRLPLGSGQQMVRLAANMPAELFESRQKRSSFYVVRRGDTAGKIARLHGISLSELRLANQLDRRATIYAGQNLRIPRADEKIIQLANVGKRPVEKRLASLEPQAVADLEPVVDVAAPLTAGPAVQPEMEEQPVSSPEESNLPEPAVAALANLRLARVETSADRAPGMEMELQSSHVHGQPSFVDDKLPADAAFEGAPAADGVAGNARPELPLVNPAVVIGHLQVERVLTENGKRIGIIRVEAEETLGHYAEWLDIRAQKIRRLNNIRFGQAIRVDQQIKIPLTKVDKDRFEERRYEYHKEIEEDFFAAYRVEDVRSYQIKRGDNIWSLCQGEFELPFWLIKKYNENLDFNGLRPAQKLIVPVVEATS